MKSNFIKTKTYIGHKIGKNLYREGLHPSQSSFLLGTRKHIAILNIKTTSSLLIKALYVTVLILQTKGNLLIVNTNPDFSKFIKNLIENQFKTHQIYYCNSKWVGGTLTNWENISKSILTFSTFSKKLGTYLNINNIHFPRYKKMKKSFQGFIKKTISEKEKNSNGNLKFLKKPDIIFLVNPNDNRNIINEANCLNIPVIALTDSNTKIKGITYPIPTNGNSFEFIHFYFSWLYRLLGRLHRF